MKVFTIEDGFSYSQVHTVVAESYGDAERLWKEKYKSEPKSITLYSDYVIVQTK